jgi:hypothetical protein
MRLIFLLFLEVKSVVKWFFKEDLSKEQMKMLQRDAAMKEMERMLKK